MPGHPQRFGFLIYLIEMFTESARTRMEWWWGGKGRLLMAGGGGALIIERMVYCLKGLIRKLKSPQNPAGARAEAHETWNSSRHWSEERRLRQKKKSL